MNKDLITTLLELKVMIQDEIDDIEKYYNHYDEQIYYDGQLIAYNVILDWVNEKLEKLSEE